MRTLRRLGSPSRHYLRVGIAVSLAVHAAAMLLPQVRSVQRPRPAPALEVVLVNARTESVPVQARMLAQNPVDGGGDAERGTASSLLPRTGESAQTAILQALHRRELQLQAEQQRLLTQLRAPRRAPAERQAEYAWNESSEPGRDDDDQDAVLQNARIAALAARIEEHSQRPRKHFFAPSTSPSRYAQYVDAWRTRVETVGTRHYPEQARGRIYGSLRMTVTLRADGTVLDVEIDQPSDQPILNQAARRIVELASPFEPFPPDIAAETDILSITRTWNFVNDSLDTHAP